MEFHQKVLGIAELSVLLKKSAPAIIADRSRAPHRVPPSCEPPGSKQPLWILEDVIAWLRSHQRATAPVTATPAPAPAAELAPPRRRGRPTKREQLERQQAAQQAQGKGGAA